MTTRPIPLRAMLLLPGVFALLTGLDAALMLLGVRAPVQDTSITAVHGIMLTLWRRSTDVAVLIQAAGAVLATGAALLWLGGLPVPDLLPWLSGFLILTIVGERLELARVAMFGTRAEVLLVAIAFLMIIGTVAALLWPTVGYPVFGASLLATVAWLGRFDIVRRTWHTTGLTRYVAISLAAGYLWLLVPAVIWLLAGQQQSGRGYDAVALLHASLLLRLAVGDARDLQGAVVVGGVLNIVAVLGFIAVALYSAVSA